MKKKCIALLLIAGLCVGQQQVARADPITLIIKAAVTKVLKAMDLAVQRLQTATIKLQNIQKSLENVMSQLNLDEIYAWTAQQKELFDGYYQELRTVKSYIAYFHKTRDIIDRQLLLVEEYKRAMALFSKDKNISADPEKMRFISAVYDGLLQESIRNVGQISNIISSFSTQMSDAKRLEFIHMTADAVNRNLNDLRSFTRQQIMLSLEKARDAHELSTLKSYYGITD